MPVLKSGLDGRRLGGDMSTTATAGGLDPLHPGRLIVAVLIPLVAFGLQCIFWVAIQPYVWFLFYPAVFFSSWVGGMRGGLAATGLSAGLVWYFFIPPQYSFAVQRPMSLVSVAVFAGMGVLFSIFHGRLRRANLQATESLAAAQLVRDGLEVHVQQRTADLRQANAALRDSRAMLDAALASMTDAVFISDTEGRFVEFNEAFATFHRFRTKEECAKTFAEYPALLDVFLPNGDLAPLEQWAVPRALRGETEANAEYVLRRKDTGETWVGSFSFAPIRNRDGAIVGSVVTGRDITERRRVEHELQERTSLLRVAGRIARFGGWSVDLAAGRVLWSDEVGAIHETPPGFSPSLAEGISFYAPEWKERISSVFGACARDGTPYDEEMQIITARGRRVWVRAIGEAVRNPSGAIVGVQGAFQDISERKRAEEALHESEERFRTLVEQAPEGIFIQARQRFVYVNAATVRLFGAAGPEQLLGEMVESRMHPDFRAQVRERIRLLNEQHRPQPPADLVFVGLDGSRRDVSVSGVPFEFKGEQGALVFVRDITERKRAEEALQRTHNTLVEAQRIAHLGSFEYVAATRTTVWSEEEYRIYGLDPTQPSPTYDALLAACIHPSDAALLHESFTTAMQSRSLYELEHRIVRPDGSVRWVYDLAHPYFGAQGELLRYVGATLDITERKRVEAEIRELNRTLEQRVHERTAELRAANQELESFSYAVSHDLRGPLRAMNGFSHALLEDHGATLPDGARAHLDEIILGCRRMGELIDGLLRLSRSTRGEVQCDALDLSAMARRVLGEFAAAEPGRRVTWTIEPGLTARGDARMVEVVVANLLGNAWKYTAHRSDAKIEIGAQGSGNPPESRLLAPATGFAVFFVRDNGAGFDMRHADKLFHPFQRLHREDEFPGIGIGLATVQRIVHRHGGTVRATAAPGRGATFCFSLPGAETDEEEKT